MTIETLPTVVEVAATIDHAILKPEFTREDVVRELTIARDLNVFSVCVRPSDVEFAVEFLAGTTVKVGTVAGFPHGSTTTTVKAVETLEAIDNGAVEVDIVINVGKALEGDYNYVAHEIATIVLAAKQAGVEKTKVIFENAYFNYEQIEELTKAMTSTGVDFVKTSTGYASKGADYNDVAVMSYNAGDMEVKASGGVKNLDDLLKLREVGATRFGTSNAAIILADLAQRIETGETTGASGEEY